MGKILIAEDEATSREILARTLLKLGHEVIRASNGRRAWECLEDNKDIDLLMTDVNMPEMGGRELVERLRAVDCKRDLPVIIVSAYVSVHQIADLLDNGATAFLRKPVGGRELREYIDRYLARKDQAA